jgi:ketosteroid isomerase-like protein
MAMGTDSVPDDLKEVVERYHLALGAFMQGDSEPARDLFSERDDVTLGNPFGPFARGFAHVAETMKQAASHYRDGDAVGFDEAATYVAPDLACIVEVEHLKSKVGGRDEIAPVNLRVTTVFRQEDGRWKIVHRHADPITTAQKPGSVL